MNEPPSPTADGGAVTVVGADEQHALDVDVERWCRLAASVLSDEGAVGELTLTFVDGAEIAALNAEHLGHDGPTDVLSFPLDGHGAPDAASGVPVLLGDVVVCPEVAAAQASTHAGTLDDELALLVVHGVLHVLGHDHAEAGDAARMHARELAHLHAHHWGGGTAPATFRHAHREAARP